jgi:hypothetical protein
MAREQEQWGGEVRLPAWLRRVLRRPDPEEPTPEAAHEARKARSTATVGQNADRASVGA